MARTGLTPWLDSLNEYALYAFEFAYVLITSLIIGFSRIRLRFQASALNLAGLAAALLMGTGVFKFAGVVGLTIPFNLRDTQTLILLLAVGPVLEELLFRQALWFGLEATAARFGERLWWVPWIVTSLLFSAGHFEAYSSVPAELKTFVLYQTVYTLMIALWWGGVYQKQKSVGLTIALHVCFNFGFWLGSWV